jgi:hypothetical protein
LKQNHLARHYWLQKRAENTGYWETDPQLIQLLIGSQTFMLVVLSGHIFKLKDNKQTLYRWAEDNKHRRFQISWDWLKGVKRGKFKACNILKLQCMADYWGISIGDLYAYGVQRLRETGKPPMKMVPFAW